MTIYQHEGKDVSLMDFNVGDKIRIVPDRRASWMEDREYEVIKIRSYGALVPGVSHHQSLLLKNREGWMSGWWFDPGAPTVVGDDLVV